MNIQTNFKKGSSSLLYIGISAVIVIGGIIWYSNQKSTIAPTKDNTAIEDSDEDKNEERDEKDDKEDAMEANVKVVAVKGSPFKFEPNEIKVKKGEKVKIVFTNEKGTHDLVIDEFDENTDILKEGESDSFDFTADKAGTFEYYCSVGNHRAQGMVGKLIVE